MNNLLSPLTEAETDYLRGAFARRRTTDFTINAVVYIATAAMTAFAALMIRLFIDRPSWLNGVGVALSVGVAGLMLFATVSLLRQRRSGRDVRLIPLAGRLHSRMESYGQYQVVQNYVGDMQVDIPPHWYRTLTQTLAPMQFRAVMAMITAREPTPVPFQIIGAENGLSIDYETSKGLGSFPAVASWIIIGLILTGLAAFVLIASALTFEPYNEESAREHLFMAWGGGGAVLIFLVLAALCVSRNRRAKAFGKRLEAAYAEIGVRFVM